MWSTISIHNWSFGCWSLKIIIIILTRPARWSTRAVWNIFHVPHFVLINKNQMASQFNECCMIMCVIYRESFVEFLKKIKSLSNKTKAHNMRHILCFSTWIAMQFLENVDIWLMISLKYKFQHCLYEISILNKIQNGPNHTQYATIFCNSNLQRNSLIIFKITCFEIFQQMTIELIASNEKNRKYTYSIQWNGLRNWGKIR